jgi:DUF4097 and DUF4098 domain-containing protein YvlB
MPMRRLALTAALCLTLAAPAWAQHVEGSFERVLKVSGSAEVSVRSGSGNIRVLPGPGDTVKVSARLRANTFWVGNSAITRIREIEKNPPVEQNGNTIRIGHFADESLTHNVSISYEITVPEAARVDARTGSGGIDIGDVRGPVDVGTGSGSITVGRVAGAVTASTGSGGIEVHGAAGLDAHSGSGSIRAAAVAGSVKVRTGSGGIHVGQAGKGDLDASSGSGEVVATGVTGAARISASSGGVTVEGRPGASWNVHASSGGITLRLPSDAAFDLAARASSGQITSAHPVTVQGVVGRHRLEGKVRGGGPLVDVSSSSGGIRIE